MTPGCFPLFMSHSKGSPKKNCFAAVTVQYFDVQT